MKIKKKKAISKKETNFLKRYKKLKNRCNVCNCDGCGD